MASKDTKSEKLNRLLNSVEDSVLQMSDEEVIQEATEEGINVTEFTKTMQDMVRHEIASSRKQKLLQSRKAYESQSINSKADILANMDVPQMLALLKQAIDGGRVTMAFRDGEGMSENDLRNLLEDLDVLGIMNADNEK